MSWFRTASRGAAYEYGRRMWRWYALAHITRAVARRAGPTLLILITLTLAVWTAIRFAAWWLPRLAALAAASTALGIALWAWRRWRWRIRAGHHRVAALAGACLLAATLGITALIIR